MAMWKIGNTVYDDNPTPAGEETLEPATIPRGFIKLTMNDDRPIMIQVDMIESFVEGVGSAKGNTVIFTLGCTDDEGDYWVKEKPEEVATLINNARR